MIESFRVMFTWGYIHSGPGWSPRWWISCGSVQQATSEASSPSETLPARARARVALLFQALTKKKRLETEETDSNRFTPEAQSKIHQRTSCAHQNFLLRVVGLVLSSGGRNGSSLFMHIAMISSHVSKVETNKNSSPPLYFQYTASRAAQFFTGLKSTPRANIFW